MTDWEGETKKEKEQSGCLLSTGLLPKWASGYSSQDGSGWGQEQGTLFWLPIWVARSRAWAMPWKPGYGCQCVRWLPKTLHQSAGPVNGWYEINTVFNLFVIWERTSERAPVLCFCPHHPRHGAKSHKWRPRLPHRRRSLTTEPSPWFPGQHEQEAGGVEPVSHPGLAGIQIHGPEHLNNWAKCQPLFLLYSPKNWVLSPGL